jgi:PiT family inorganic phosphate transporter
MTSSIMGVGATRRLTAVRWSVAKQVVFAWVLTIPGAAFAAAIVYYLANAIIHI